MPSFSKKAGSQSKFFQRLFWRFWGISKGYDAPNPFCAFSKFLRAALIHLLVAPLEGRREFGFSMTFSLTTNSDFHKRKDGLSSRRIVLTLWIRASIFPRMSKGRSLSSESLDAATVAVERARKTLQHIRSVYVENLTAEVSAGEIKTYRLNAKIFFDLESDEVEPQLESVVRKSSLSATLESPIAE